MGIKYYCEIKQHGYFDTKNCPKCNKIAIGQCHRTCIKIILNPLFRVFGFQIVSVINNQNEFLKYEFRRLARKLLKE